MKTSCVRDSIPCEARYANRSIRWVTGCVSRCRDARFRKDISATDRKKFSSLPLENLRRPWHLKDLGGDHIKGSFYCQKLQVVSKPDDALFDIDRIVKTRNTGGKVEYLVKWREYHERFNSWVEALTKKNKKVISDISILHCRPTRRWIIWTRRLSLWPSYLVHIARRLGSCAHRNIGPC